MKTKYVIGVLHVVKRDGLNSPIIEYRADERFGIHDSSRLAKGFYMRLYNPELSHYDLEKDLDFLVSHFDALSRNLKYVKVLKKVV